MEYGKDMTNMRQYIFAGLFLLLSIASCENVVLTEIQNDSDILSAKIDQEMQSKTEMDENNNILWTEKDQIIGFIKSSIGHRYEVKSEFIGKPYADFSKVSSNTEDNLPDNTRFDHVVAYYPYEESVNCARSGDHYELDVILPMEQTYAAGSFGNENYPMIAVSTDNKITFRNICGGIKLQIKGSIIVKSIRIEGKNNEKLSGNAVVTGYSDGRKPLVSMSATACTSAVLNCLQGVELKQDSATTFIITLPPTEFTNGFVVTITDTKDQTYTIETSKSNSVLRSSLLKMPEVTIDSKEDENIDFTLSQGYASEGTLNNNASHRVKTSFIYGSFSVKVNDGYVIRAVYTYPTNKVSADYTCVLANCTDRTEIDVMNEGRYAIVTFANASDPKASILPTENIVKSLTRYNIALPDYPGCPYISSAVFFGDSIMHGVYSYYETDSNGKVLRKNGFDSNSYSYLRIPDYFGLMAGATVTNNGKRGSGWITDTRNLGNALEMANKTDFSKYDFAAFCLGINDWIQGAKVGSLDNPGSTGNSISEGTVVANMIACIEKVKKENPSCKMVVYSPYISWGQYSDGGDYTSKTLYGDESTDYALGAVNKAGYTLQELIDVIDQVCRYYGIRHVPLSRSKVCTKDNVKDIMIDGLHPSREIRQSLAEEILKEGTKGLFDDYTDMNMTTEDGKL